MMYISGQSTIKKEMVWMQSIPVTSAVRIPENPRVRHYKERIKKATRLAGALKVCSFNTRPDAWREQGRAGFSELNASVYRFGRENMLALSALVQRTLGHSTAIRGESFYVAADTGESEVSWLPLQVP
jgi:uncharacterized protein YaeQ